MQFGTLIGGLQQLATRYGYFGVFFLSLLGALSIVVPIPDTTTVFTLAGLRVGSSFVFNPLLIAAIATLGSGVGQGSGYILGVKTKKANNGGNYQRNSDFLVDTLGKFGSIGIFAFALTPLPDNLMFIPLGMARYNPVKAFIPGLAGKFLLSLLVVYAARYSIGAITSTLGGGSNLLSFAISAVLGLAVTMTMFLVDWGKCLGKLRKH